MTQRTSTTEERFDALIEALVDQPGVTLGSPGNQGFGSSALQINGKIFAMLSRGRLVLKLPRQRVDALVASGDGQRFDPRQNGRLMKEWLTLEPASEQAWLPLAGEAMQFVAAKG